MRKKVTGTFKYDRVNWNEGQLMMLIKLKLVLVVILMGWGEGLVVVVDRGWRGLQMVVVVMMMVENIQEVVWLKCFRFREVLVRLKLMNAWGTILSMLCYSRKYSSQKNFCWSSQLQVHNPLTRISQYAAQNSFLQGASLLHNLLCFCCWYFILSI